MASADRGDPRPDVNRFVQRVRQRLNRSKLLTILQWAFAGATVTLLVVAIVYVIRGYQVPWQWYPLVLSGGAIVGLRGWWVRRADRDAAAHLADRQFGLKDAVRSCQNFSAAHREGGFYELQAEQTRDRVAGANLAAIGFRPSWKLVGCAVALFVLSVALGLKGPSDRVVQREQARQQSLAVTTAVNEELKQLVDELDKLIDDEEERELIKPDQLREWVDQLESQADPREALRQYADLERKIQRAADSLQNRRDEQLLDRAAKELKGNEANRKLGELLEQKKYDQAAQQLKEMKPAEQMAKTDRKISERQKELARLRSMAQQMADAARQSIGSNQSDSARQSAAAQKNSAGKSGQSNRTGAGKSGGNSQSSDASTSDPAEENADESPGEEDLADTLQELDEAVRELEEAVESGELIDADEREPSDDELECEACAACVDGELDQLAKRLKKLARARAAQMRLKQLAGKCAQCYSDGVARVASDSPGGREAGQGSSDRARSDTENPEVAGPTEVLKGLKGEGPSLFRTEAADSGTGVSGQRTQAVQREFQKQFESFVERADIPDDLKSGVKNYFLQIHQSMDASSNALPVENAER
jgi:hypothetical protein